MVRTLRHHGVFPLFAGNGVRNEQKEEPMEGYDVVSSDDQKVGHVVATENGYLIVESGMLRKTKHAIPLDMTRVDEEDEAVRLSVSKQLVEEGPALDDDDRDWTSVDDYYGRSADLEGQTAADIPTSDEQRAELRESLQSPDTDIGPPKGAVGIHQDRWEVKE
jgi:hypothetical protein